MKRILISVLLWLSACGGGDGSGGVSIPIDDLEARVADALCAYEVRCGWAPDKAGCDESTFTRQQLVADVKAGKVNYDGKAAAACLDLYGALSCKVSEEGLSRLGRTQSCTDAIKGTVSPGGPCVTGEACESQVCDWSACTAACCAGTCAARILVGGDCSTLGAACADDLFCKRGGPLDTGICAPLIADGEPCTSGDQCAAGRRCNVVMGTSAGTGGVCVPPADEPACT